MPHLQLLCPLLGEGLVLRGEHQPIVLCQGAQVKVVLGVHAGQDVDVELQLLQVDSLQLIPATMTNSCTGTINIKVPRNLSNLVALWLGKYCLRNCIERYVATMIS